MSLQRREFFAILGITVASSGELLAEHDHHASALLPDFAAYRPQALTSSEYALVTDLSECLLPADDTGPGARDAHVVYYIDVVLKHGPAPNLQRWKSGLASVQSLIDLKLKKPLNACSDAERQELMAKLSKNELAPATSLDSFFVEFKRLTIDAFYASELIQREHLGYRGNTAVSEFVGCTHKNFEHNDTE